MRRRPSLLLLLTLGCTGEIAGTASGPSQPGERPASSPGRPGAVAGSPAAFAPAPARMRRLTNAQHANAVRDLLGAGVTVSANLDPDEKELGFSSVGAHRVTSSAQTVEKYRLAAFEAARQAFRTPEAAAALVGCTPAAATDPCVTAFLRAFGRRAFRRAITAEELAAYARVVSVAAGEQGGALAGLEFAVAAFLQDPAFLYVPGLTEADPDDRGRLRYTGAELATRLSLTLWNTIPDEALLTAAERGELGTADGVRAQAERLLASDRARAGIVAFFAEHLGFSELDQVVKDRKLFPAFDAALATSMRGELDRAVAALALGDASFTAVFDTRATEVDRALAALYGLPAVTAWTRVEHPANGPRGGLLTMAGVLARNALVARSSPTQRGVFVRERVLCQQVPEPPADIVNRLDEPAKTGTAPGTTAARTMRERLERHRTDPACSSCHAFFDPIGLALEPFDAVGAHRTTEGGATIDTRGELDGRTFDGPRALGALLRDDPRTMTCLVRELYRHATGREDGPGDRPLLDELGQRFTAGGHRVRRLLIDLVASPAFRTAAKAP